MTAERLAKNALMDFMENKTRDFYPEQEWGFYRDLLEYAKNYKPDFSGYIPPEYKAVDEVCKREGFHLLPVPRQAAGRPGSP